jgi:DNA-binding MarR family transcriptional regulator
MVVRRPNPRDGRGTLAEITQRGRDAAEAATADLMAARFGMGGFDAGELGQLFALLRGLRLEAGDFVAEPGEAGPEGESPALSR